MTPKTGQDRITERDAAATKRIRQMTPKNAKDSELEVRRPALVFLGVHLAGLADHFFSGPEWRCEKIFAHARLASA
jgi:hypothetical protein